MVNAENRRVNRSFPFGPAPLALLILALLSGFYLIARPPGKRTATLTMWTFAKAHYDAYQKIIPQFERENPGVRVDLQLIAGNALNQRLQAAFQADLDVPDIVEVEISAAGTFFRGPIEHVGFWPLNTVLEREGWKERIVNARFAPYTREGRIFGLPHDVHPVMLAYRRDIFAKAGVTVADLSTWDDFIRVGKKLTQPGKTYMIEFADSNPSQLEVCLFQRGGGYFDQSGSVIFDNEISVETMKWYVPLVAESSKSRIGNSISGGQVMTQAMEEGYFLSVVTPDWRSKLLETDIGQLSGKMGLMPFPAVEKNGRRTSTWGGTMLGITQKCADKELAWKFAKNAYLNEKELAHRFAQTYILPPLKAAWEEPAFDQPVPYYANQAIGRAYATLAVEVPFQYTSPFISLAKAKLGEALIADVQYYRRNGENGFDNFVRQTLKEKADQVRKQVARNPF